MREIFIALRKLGLPLVIDMHRVSHHTRSAFFNHHANYYTKMLMRQRVIYSCWFIKLAEKMQVIQKEDNFGKLVSHCLLRKNS